MNFASIRHREELLVPSLGTFWRPHSVIVTNPPAAFDAVQACEKSQAAELFGGV